MRGQRLSWKKSLMLVLKVDKLPLAVSGNVVCCGKQLWLLPTAWKSSVK